MLYIQYVLIKTIFRYLEKEKPCKITDYVVLNILIPLFDFILVSMISYPVLFKFSGYLSCTL